VAWADLRTVINFSHKIEILIPITNKYNLKTIHNYNYITMNSHNETKEYHIHTQYGKIEYNVLKMKF